MATRPTAPSSFYAKASLLIKWTPPCSIRDDRGYRKTHNKAVKDEIQVKLIINNRAGGNAPLIAQKITHQLNSQEKQIYFTLRPWNSGNPFREAKYPETKQFSSNLVIENFFLSDIY